MKQLNYSTRQILFAQYPDEIVFLMRCYSDENKRLAYIKEISQELGRVNLRWVVQLVFEAQYYMSSKSDLVRGGRFPESLAARIFEPEPSLSEG